MLTVAPGGNNLATICYKDFLGLATINMYYYYYYYYKLQISSPRIARTVEMLTQNKAEVTNKTTKNSERGQMRRGRNIK